MKSFVPASSDNVNYQSEGMHQVAEEDFGRDSELIETCKEIADIADAPEPSGYASHESAIVRIWRTILWDRGVACCIVASVFYSLTPVFVKLLDNTPVFQIAMARSALCLPWTLVVLSAQGNLRLWESPKNVPWLVARGFSGAGAMVGLYSSVQISPLADAQTVFMMYPALICLFTFLFLGERMTLWQVVGLIASMAGVVLVAHPTMLFGQANDHGPLQEEQLQHITTKGLTFALVGAVLAALSILIVRILSARESAVVQTMWFQIVVSLICIPPVAAGWPKPIVTDYAPKGWIFLLCVGACSFVSQLLYNRGGQLLSGAMAGCIVSAQVPMAYAWGVLLFDEPPTLLSSCGTVLVIGGLITVTMNKPRPKETAPNNEAQNPSAPTTASAFINRIVKIRSAGLLLKQHMLSASSSCSSSMEMVAFLHSEDSGFAGQNGGMKS